MAEWFEHGGTMWLSLGFVVAGVLALAVVIWRGCVRWNALADGPTRATGLIWVDLPIGFVVMVAGMVAAWSVSELVFEMQPGGGGPTGGTRVLGAWLLVQQIIGQGVVLAYIMWRTMGVPQGWRRFGLLPRDAGRELRAGVLGLLAALPMVVGLLSLMSFVGEWLGMPAPQVGHPLLEAALRSDDVIGLALLAVAVVAVGPFMEELIFRGLVQTTLLDALGVAWRWPIVVVAGLVFAMVHVGATTFGSEAADGSSVPWHALPGLALLGVVLGWLYEKTGSLWPSVIVHAGFNAYNVALVLTMQRLGLVGIAG